MLTDRHWGNQASTGWQRSTLTIPTTATRVGFFFFSNAGTVMEGAYVDDVSVYGTRSETNRVLGTYDTNQNTTMLRGVDVDAYASARVEYRYWLETDSAADALEAGYMLAGNWTYLDPHTGSSGGWQLASFAVPINATLFGFRFTTDGAGYAEGAYIDEVRVHGTIRTLTCGANVDGVFGTEARTGFLFTATAFEGLRPYTWAWTFTDGTSAAIQNPVHYFAAAGTYTGRVTVTDAAGQTCQASPPAVTVDHDTTTAGVSPPGASVIEGRSLPLYGADGQGHAYALNWSVEPPSCGALDTFSGISTNFTAAPDAGGISTHALVRGPATGMPRRWPRAPKSPGSWPPRRRSIISRPPASPDSTRNACRSSSRSAISSRTAMAARSRIHSRAIPGGLRCCCSSMRWRASRPGWKV